VQVSTSPPKFDPGGCADPSCLQSQEGGQNFTPFLLWSSDLITFRRAVSEMRPRSSSLRAVHKDGDRRLRLRTKQEEGHRDDSQDGRGMCVLPVSENPHGHTMNDTLISDFPPPGDSQ
jgi:hypothetical protein